MINSCYLPFKTLAKNSGLSPSINILLNDNEVYNFKSYQIMDWLEAGIIDPTLVPISALTNASSVAKTILKSNSIISEWQDTAVVLSSQK